MEQFATQRFNLASLMNSLLRLPNLQRVPDRLFPLGDEISHSGIVIRYEIAARDIAQVSRSHLSVLFIRIENSRVADVHSSGPGYYQRYPHWLFGGVKSVGQYFQRNPCRRFSDLEAQVFVEHTADAQETGGLGKSISLSPFAIFAAGAADSLNLLVSLG
jgi:hypothetical protein